MKATVLYSGGCPFCRWAARQLEHWTDLNLIPFREPEALTMFRQVGIEGERRFGSWWIIWGKRHCEYTAWSGDDRGWIALMYAIPKLRPLGVWLDRWAFADWVFDRVDRLIKRSRPFLSRLVPDGYAPKRITRW